jgi:hypothetical protein
MIKSKRMRLMECVACIIEQRYAYTLLVGRSEGNSRFEDFVLIGYNIKVDLK